MNHTKIQYLFTWISLSVFLVGSLVMVILSWNGVLKGSISTFALILSWTLVLASGIYLFLLAVKKAHRQWVTEEREKQKQEDLKLEARAGRRSSKKDQALLDPAATARKIVRRIPEEISPADLGKELLANLSRELEIMSGVFYYREGTRFEVGESFALASPQAPEAFAPGEGLNGQVAQSLQLRVLTTLPEGYLEVCSGLGRALPSYLAIVPLVQDKECTALVECAGYKHEARDIESTLRILARDLGEKLYPPKS